MPVDNLDLFSNENLPQQWEGAENGREGGASIDDPVWQVVNFDTICEVSHACSRWTVVSVRYYDHPVAAIDEFLFRVSLWHRKYVGLPLTDDS